MKKTRENSKGTALSRRTFLETIAVGGAALAAGATLASCAPRKAENKADGSGKRSGSIDYYTTLCHGCITQCPVKVYVQDGVAIKIEGHPDGPKNAGAVCVKGLNQIHTCYSPRRILYPLRRVGARGAENATFERMSWEDAVEEAATRISDAILKYGTYSFFSSTGGGGAYVDALTPPYISGSVLGTCGFEPGAAQCFMPRVSMAQYVWGGNNQSMADDCVVEPWKGLSKADREAGIEPSSEVLVLWGTQPSCSQTAHAGRAITECRMRGMKTIVVDPNFSADAAKATIHLPLRPGSDCALMLSWYRYIFENELYDKEFAKYFTNLPFLLNPETKLPWLAEEVFPDYVSPTPEDTPVYICIDEDSGEVVPLPFGYPNEINVNPLVMGTAIVNGTECKTVGQIYWESAEPWTLERAEEFCWVPADRNKAAIELYAGQSAMGKCAGIVHGVATDMTEISSQATLGLLGLDCIMGYINKPGATLTGQGGGFGFTVPEQAPLDSTNEWGKCPADGVLHRPTFSYVDQFEYGYVVGETEEANSARVGSMDQNCQNIWATIVRDRIGVRNHRGLTAWQHAHIPSIRQAIETGEPYALKAWMDTSGNKLAMLGSAGAWYNAAIDNVDFITCQYPNMTSFHVELADMIFPTQEWLEIPNSGLGPMNYTFCNAAVTHLGEAVPPWQPWSEIMQVVYDKLNKQADKVVFTGTGQTLAELGITLPMVTPSDAFGSDDISVDDYWRSEIESKCEIVGVSPDATTEEYLEAVKNNPNAYSVYDPTEYWIYGQHLVKAVDGLPVGFATESRKCEPYCTLALKMSRTGWPYCYPQGFDEPVDTRIGSFDGEYTPVCNVPHQVEAPYVPNSEGYIMPFDEDFPLALTSGRVPFFHHGTMRHSPFARELYPAPFMRINPRTAEEYGIEDGDWVEISSRRTQGEPYDVNNPGTERSYNKVKEHNTKVGDPIHAIAYVSEVVAPNTVWMERFWNPECFDSTQKTKTGGWQECNVNILTNAIDAHYNEMFGSYTNRGIAVNVKKSERPERIWVQPKEFEPFMPTTSNELDSSVGVLISNPDMRTDPPSIQTGHTSIIADSVARSFQASNEE